MFKFLLAVGLCSTSSAFAQKIFDEPLKPLAVTLTADFSLVNTPRQTGPEIGRNDLGQGMIDAEYFKSVGTMAYKADDGSNVSVQVEIEPRGMRRRRDCTWKPLDVNPVLKQTDELLKGNKGSLEVSTHCTGQDRIRALYNEYFNYRLKNAFDVPAFQVRLAKITYVDTKNKMASVTEPAVFMESKKNLGKRMDGEAMHLTKEEEAIPPTAEEVQVGSWARFYGDSFVPRMTERYRIYKKYLAALDKVPMTIKQAMIEKLSKSLVSSYDVVENYMLNTFAWQWNNKAVMMVEYDFDDASPGHGWSSNTLQEVYGRYARSLGLSDINGYNSKRTEAEKKADRDEVLKTLEAILAHYEASGLEQEMNDWKEREFSPSGHKNTAENSVKAMKDILANPAKAFAFVKGL